MRPTARCCGVGWSDGRITRVPRSSPLACEVSCRARRWVRRRGQSAICPEGMWVPRPPRGGSANETIAARATGRAGRRSGPRRAPAAHRSRRTLGQAAPARPAASRAVSAPRRGARRPSSGSAMNASWRYAQRAGTTSWSHVHEGSVGIPLLVGARRPPVTGRRWPASSMRGDTAGRRVLAMRGSVVGCPFRTDVRSCGDAWFRQGLVIGEREPRMLLRPR